MKFSIDAIAPDNKHDFLKLIEKLEEDAKLARIRKARLWFTLCYLIVAVTLGFTPWISGIPSDQYKVFHALYSLMSAYCAYEAAKHFSHWIDKKSSSPELQSILDETNRHKIETIKFI